MKTRKWRKKYTFQTNSLSQLFPWKLTWVAAMSCFFHPATPPPSSPGDFLSHCLFSVLSLPAKIKKKKMKKREEERKKEDRSRHVARIFSLGGQGNKEGGALVLN